MCWGERCHRAQQLRLESVKQWARKLLPQAAALSEAGFTLRGQWLPFKGTTPYSTHYINSSLSLLLACKKQSEFLVFNLRSARA